MAAPPREPQWHEKEKIMLLAEIIKTHATDPQYLLHVVHNLRIPAIQWNDVVPPPGRTVNSCRNAFEELRRQYGMFPSQSPPGPYTPQLGSGAGVKRQLQPEGAGGPFQPIRPKPPAPSGSMGQPPPNEPPTKRKRGRPPKAAAQQQRQEEARARGEPSRPAAIASATATPIEAKGPPLAPPPPLSIPQTHSQEEIRSFSQPSASVPSSATTRMDISTMLTPATKSASQSSSSSGKRRRGRSSRSDLGSSRQQPTTAQEYGSPMPRGTTTMPSDDTPARAAILRHRDETEMRPGSVSVSHVRPPGNPLAPPPQQGPSSSNPPPGPRADY